MGIVASALRSFAGLAAMGLLWFEGDFLQSYGLIVPKDEGIFLFVGWMCILNMIYMALNADRARKLTLSQMLRRFPGQPVAPLILNPGLWSNDFLTTPLFAFIFVRYVAQGAGQWPEQSLFLSLALGWIVSFSLHRLVYAYPKHVDPFVDKWGKLSNVAWQHHAYETYALTCLAFLLLAPTPVEPEVLLITSIILGLHVFVFFPGNVLWLARKMDLTITIREHGRFDWAPTDIRPSFWPLIAVIAVCGLDWYGNYQGAIVGIWKVLTEFCFLCYLLIIQIISAEEWLINLL